MKLGILYSRVRTEEKLLFQTADRLGIEVIRLNDEALIWNIQPPPTPRHSGGRLRRPIESSLAKPTKIPEVDLVLDRSIAHLREEISLKLLEARGIQTINSCQAAITCNNKILTDMALAQAGIPIPKTLIASSKEGALEAIEQLGYPVVLKPSVGSWGRLLAKINDRQAAEAVLEHKEMLSSLQHQVFYIQEYIQKPGRDIRALVVGDRLIAAMYRYSDHWITNTARGSCPVKCKVTSELETLVLRASQAVGTEIAGVDVVESHDGLQVLEINAGVEFHGLMETTETQIAEEIITYCINY